jgi:hypothetical protein
MSIESEKVTELIRTNTELTSIFLEKEAEINAKVNEKIEELEEWKNARKIIFATAKVGDLVRTVENGYISLEDMDTKEGEDIIDLSTATITIPSSGIYQISSQWHFNTDCKVVEDGGFINIFVNNKSTGGRGKFSKSGSAEDGNGEEIHFINVTNKYLTKGDKITFKLDSLVNGSSTTSFVEISILGGF